MNSRKHERVWEGLDGWRKYETFWREERGGGSDVSAF